MFKLQQVQGPKYIQPVLKWFTDGALITFLASCSGVDSPACLKMIQISWLLQKPSDLDLHCLQRPDISWFNRTRFNLLQSFSVNHKSCSDFKTNIRIRRWMWMFVIEMDKWALIIRKEPLQYIQLSMLLGSQIRVCWCRLMHTVEYIDEQRRQNVQSDSRSSLFTYYIIWLFMSVSRPIWVQLVVFFCCSIPMVLFDNPGISKCFNMLFLLSPHLCFIIGFICDLFVARNDSWTS